MPHRGGYAGWLPVTGEAWEARGASRDHTMPGCGQAPGRPPVTRLKNRANATCHALGADNGAQAGADGLFLQLAGGGAGQGRGE